MPDLCTWHLSVTKTSRKCLECRLFFRFAFTCLAVCIMISKVFVRDGAVANEHNPSQLFVISSQLSKSVVTSIMIIKTRTCSVQMIAGEVSLVNHSDTYSWVSLGWGMEKKVDNAFLWVCNTAQCQKGLAGIMWSKHTLAFTMFKC